MVNVFCNIDIRLGRCKEVWIKATWNWWETRTTHRLRLCRVLLRFRGWGNLHRSVMMVTLYVSGVRYPAICSASPTTTTARSCYCTQLSAVEIRWYKFLHILLIPYIGRHSSSSINLCNSTCSHPSLVEHCCFPELIPVVPDLQEGCLPDLIYGWFGHY